MSQPKIAVSSDCPSRPNLESGYVTWKQWAQTDFGQCSRLDSAFFDVEVLPLLEAGSPHSRVLELGFGNGPFLGWCRRRNIPYEGIEIEPTMLERARVLGVSARESIFDPAFEPLAGSFELIAAFDVIEHIEQGQLPSLFAAVEKLLKLGGHFVAKFPNGDSPFGRINQHGDMTHVTTLGRGKIEHLASLSKLTVVSIGDPKRPWKHVGIATAVRRLTGGMAKSIIEGAIRSLYFGGEPVSFDRNTVAVLRK
jgi:SAM-dependent methyltransferase